MSHDDIICSHCGNECWPDEMKDSDKCWICFVQDCRHPSSKIVREYAGSTM
jgi:hypothetical protein